MFRRALELRLVALPCLVGWMLLASFGSLASAQAPASPRGENAAGLAAPRAHGASPMLGGLGGPSGLGAPALPEPGALPAPLPPPLDASHLPGYGRDGDDPVSLRIDTLGDHLASLGARRTSGVGDGLVSLLLGGTYIGLGVYANRNDAPGGIATYFYLSGAGSIASAAVHFGLQPNAERRYAEFQALAADPSLTPVERLRRSEHLLHSMAKRRMAARYAQAGINLGITIGSLPILLGGDGFDSSSPFEWAILATSGISVVSSVMTIIQRTEEERRWRMYRTYASAHGGDAVFTVAHRPRLRLGDVAVAPSPSGGHVVARFVF